ncbi:MAG TPA: creatininase family protein [Terriglobia bacterium]|nr:creatininase family protein [Terriglobia bacterium]
MILTRYRRRLAAPGRRTTGDAGGVPPLLGAALVAVLAAIVAPALARAQGSLSVHWEELTAEDFVTAIHRSQGVCVLPIGILEKHGPHLPIGNDLINVRYASLAGAQQEYAIVFPEYYFGQIFEARHEPGTVAYSWRMQLDLLQETTDEMARNGCKKIIIANGHGGNVHLLPFFAQSQLAERHDYVVYIFGMPHLANLTGRPPLRSDFGGHADEAETSHTIVARPDLVHMDRVNRESGRDQNRLKLPDTLYTGIWWYAKFPEHYAGDASGASKELGEFDMKVWVNALAEAIRAVKADDESLRLQNEFYEKAGHPVDTKQ